MSDGFNYLAKSMAKETSRRKVLKAFGGALVVTVAGGVLRPWRGDAKINICATGTNVGSAPCASGQTTCGDCCCQAGTACVNKSKSKCGCPSGTSQCGNACCAAGVACASKSKSLCAGQAAKCLDTCYPSGDGTQCCCP